MNIFSYRNRSKGFSLIELLVAISIVSLLSSVVLSSVRSATLKSRDTKRFTELRQVGLALELYYNVNGSYPNYSNVSPEYNWSDMLGDLIAGKFLAISTYHENTNPLAFLENFSLINYVFASVPMGPANIRPQDPLYPSVSYSYMPSNDLQSFRLRSKLESSANPTFNSGLTGKFLDNSLTGDTSCDKSLLYYCFGPAGNFTPYGY